MAMAQTATIRCPGCQGWHDRQPTRYDASGYLCHSCQFELAADDRDAEPIEQPDNLDEWTEAELVWLRAQDDPKAAEHHYCALLQEVIDDPTLFALLAEAAERA